MHTHPSPNGLRSPWNFPEAKVAHLKRAGLVANNKTGYGRNGGACPDWLLAEQEAEAKRRDKALYRAVVLRSGGKQPDIEWHTGPVAL